VRPQSSLEEIISKSQEETKLITEMENFAIIIDILHMKSKKQTGNREENMN
jgi:hypothetical protein